MLLTIVLLLTLAGLLFHKKENIILSILCRISTGVYIVLNKKENCETIKDFKIVTLPFRDKFRVDHMFTSCSIFLFCLQNLKAYIFGGHLRTICPVF